MKTAFTLLLFFLINVKTGYSQADLKLSHQIDSLSAEDQKWRNEFNQADKMQLNTATRKSILKKVMLWDSLNYPMLKKIFHEHGYPGYDVVGKKSAHNFWLLVQYQDKHPGFQDSVLVKMKMEVDKKNASSADYAKLVDKVKVNAKQLQVYGTQLQINKGSTSYEPKPVMEPEKLNERRKSVGLSSIEEYIELMNSGYFEPAKKK